MNKKWFFLFRKLFITNSKEFLRDFLSVLFSIVMPTVFMVTFGMARSIQKGREATLQSGGMNESDSFLFIMLGLLSLGLVSLSLFGTAMPLVDAKEKGILRQYMQIPMPLSALLAAHVYIRVVVALIQGGILLLTARFAFGVTIAGNLVQFFAVYVICAAVLITCGYALAGLMKRASMATALLMFLNFYMLVFGQIFSDMRGVPIAEWLIYTTPVASVSDILRQISLGEQWGNLSIGTNLTILLGWVLLAYFVGLRKFRFLPE